MNENKTISLRPLTWNDLDRMEHWPPFPPPYDVYTERHRTHVERVGWLRSLADDPSHNALAIDLQDVKTIGWIHLVDLGTPTPLIGINMRHDCWGQGYGTEAMRQVLEACFRRQQVKAARLMVQDWNTRARGIYERLGFEAIGRHRATRSTSHVTFVDMELTREQWERTTARWGDTPEE